RRIDERDPGLPASRALPGQEPGGDRDAGAARFADAASDLSRPPRRRDLARSTGRGWLLSATPIPPKGQGGLAPRLFQPASTVPKHQGESEQEVSRSYRRVFS